MTSGGEIGAIGQACVWLLSALGGPIVTVLAVLAVASIGFAMLSGSLPVRRGLSTLVGCFLLFGASSIAQDLVTFSTSVSDGDVSVENATIFDPPESTPAQVAKPVVRADPYAGAALLN